MSIAEHITSVFGEQDLYSILGVSRTSSSSEIKKAYFRLARVFHPDKCPGDEEATRKFQALGMIHSILSDPEKRSSYDESGSIDDSNLSEETSTEWYEYWRALFPKVTLDDILRFEAGYKGSDQEKQDLIKAYKKFKGNMEKIMQFVILADDNDEERFREILTNAIEEGLIRHYRAFDERTTNKKKK